VFSGILLVEAPDPIASCRTIRGRGSVWELDGKPLDKLGFHIQANAHHNFYAFDVWCVSNRIDPVMSKFVEQSIDITFLDPLVLPRILYEAYPGAKSGILRSQRVFEVPACTGARS
jgi:hypothetical protein